MAKLYNLARMTTGTTGTGTITLGSAVAGHLTFAQAGVADADVVAYGIIDGSNSECGTGTYTASGTTLTRTVTKSTNSDTAISLTGNAQVFIMPRKEDILNPANNLSDLASASTSRTNLGVPGLDANTFTGQQIISGSSALFIAINVISTDAGAGVAPIILCSRDSPSPAANDVCGIFSFYGKDSAANNQEYAYILMTILDPTSTSEDAQLDLAAIIAGTPTVQISMANGVQLTNPTGGFKGTGTLNAKDVYNDNVALTCMVLADEFLRDGTVDLNKWDAMIPDILIPEKRNRQPVMINAKITDEKMTLGSDGNYVKTINHRMGKVQKKELRLVYDDKGNGLDAFEEPVFEEVVIPERREKREHKVARIFKSMCDEGFDPRDPVKYIAKLKADEALPGMPSKTEWAKRGHNDISQSELFMRKWLALEMLALVVMNHEERLQKIEGA